MKIKYSKVTDGPDAEPVSSSEIIEALKLDNELYNEESGVLSIWVKAATEIVEQRTGRSLITQTRVIKLDCFPQSSVMSLLHGPVQSVTSVKYYDADDTEQTLSADSYWVDTDSDIARIVIKQSWPQIIVGKPNAVTVTYVCGYGDSEDKVPGALKSAVLLYTGHLYKNREEGIEREKISGILDEVPFGAEMLMRPFVIEHDVIE